MKLVVNVWPKTGRHVQEARAQIWERFNGGLDNDLSITHL
jgi:hypothetical protein